MARITVEDCLPVVGNHFELVMLAAARARQLNLGAEPLVPPRNDKPTVIALREIATGLLDLDQLREDVAKRPNAETTIDLGWDEETDEITSTFEAALVEQEPEQDSTDGISQ